MGILNKTFLKFLFGFLLILAISLLIIFSVGYYQTSHPINQSEVLHSIRSYSQNNRGLAFKTIPKVSPWKFSKVRPWGVIHS